MLANSQRKKLHPTLQHAWTASFDKMGEIRRGQEQDEMCKLIKHYNEDMLPSISVLLKIVCTLPVTSCECERSASALRRLNNYMRATMGKDRLSYLALLHVHYDT